MSGVEASQGGPYDGLVRRMRARVAERRAADEYPADLEDRLAEHFERVRLHRRQESRSLRPLEVEMEELARRATFGPERIGTASSAPGGERLHKAVARAIGRQVGGILAQVQSYADQERTVLQEIVAHLGAPHLHAEIVDEIDTLADRLAQVEHAAAARTVAWYDALAWVERFEGRHDAALEQAAFVADHLGGGGPVVVVDAGRGELVEVLSRRGVEVAGYEPEPDLAERARSRGLAVADETAVAALSSRPDASLRAVAMVRNVERLGPGGVLGLVAAAARTLVPGGTFLVAALEPASAEAATARGRDPHWVAPLDADYLEFLCRQAGFGDTRVLAGTGARYLVRATR